MKLTLEQEKIRKEMLKVFLGSAERNIKEYADEMIRRAKGLVEDLEITRKRMDVKESNTANLLEVIVSRVDGKQYNLGRAVTLAMEYQSFKEGLRIIEVEEEK